MEIKQRESTLLLRPVHPGLRAESCKGTVSIAGGNGSFLVAVRSSDDDDFVTRCDDRQISCRVNSSLLAFLCCECLRAEPDSVLDVVRRNTSCFRIVRVPAAFAS